MIWSKGSYQTKIKREKLVKITYIVFKLPFFLLVHRVILEVLEELDFLLHP